MNHPLQPLVEKTPEQGDAGERCSVAVGSAIWACVGMFWGGFIGLALTGSGYFLCTIIFAWLIGVSLNTRPTTAPVAPAHKCKPLSAQRAAGKLSSPNTEVRGTAPEPKFKGGIARVP